MRGRMRRFRIRWPVIAGVIAILLIGSVIFWGTTVGRAPLTRLTDTFGGLPRFLPADIAAVASLAVLLAVTWLGWTMTATARRFYGSSDAVDDRTLYRLVLDLHAEIAGLKADVKALQYGRASGAPTQVEQVSVHPSASARLGTAQPERDTRSQVHGRGASEPTSQPHFRPPEPDDQVHRIIEDYRGHPDLNRLVAAYRSLLNGSGSMNEFERTYQPEYVALGQGDGLRGTLGDEEGPFWYIPMDADPTLGLLLPSKGPIIHWGEQFQFGGGSRAHQVFGRAFKVEDGDKLELVEPAWVQLRDQRVEVKHAGVLRGA